MAIKEIITSITKKASLLQYMEGKEITDLVEVEVGTVYNGLFVSLLLDILEHKEELTSFFSFLESEASKTTNPYELRQLNELLEVKKIVEAFDLENMKKELELAGIEI